MSNDQRWFRSLVRFPDWEGKTFLEEAVQEIVKATCVAYCVVYTTHMSEFGEYLRQCRERLRVNDPRFSVRQLAARVGVEPSYLSKVERGQQPPPSEQTIASLARELDEDPDVLLALAGKVSEELQAIIRRRPKLFADLIRQIKDMPDHAMLRLVREVRDGDW